MNDNGNAMNTYIFISISFLQSSRSTRTLRMRMKPPYIHVKPIHFGRALS